MKGSDTLFICSKSSSPYEVYSELITSAKSYTVIV